MSHMYILVALMVIDYLTGIVVAGVFKASNKSKSGALSSKAGVRGLCKKCTMLMWICVACGIDRTCIVCCAEKVITIGFIVNELISVTENLGLMRAPLPEIIKNTLDLFKKRSDNK